MRSLTALLILLTGFALGCEKSAGYKVEHYAESSIQDLAIDRKIPVQAWELLEGNEGAEGAHGHEETHGASHDSHAATTDNHGAKPAAGSKSSVLGEIKVLLVEKNEGVLKKPAIQVLLPRGGGTLDLSQYTTGQRGSFFVGFEFSPFTTATRKKVLFFSEARKRKISGQIFGAGCRQYFDITKGFLSAMEGEGIKVNSTQDRHISVLGGSFFFAAEENGEMFVAQVRFTDSEKPQFFCQEN